MCAALAARYCAPTRGSFLTGRYPYRLSATRANLIPWSLPDGINTTYTYLPKHLKKAGYAVHHIGACSSRVVCGWSRSHVDGDASSLHECVLAVRASDRQCPTRCLLVVAACCLGKWHQGFYIYEMTPPGRGFDTSLGFLIGGEDHWTSTTSNPGCKNFNAKPVDLSFGMWMPRSLSTGARVCW